MNPTPQHSPQQRIDRIFAFVESLPASDRFLIKAVALVFIASAVWLGIAASTAALVEIPHHGGTLSEGVVGTPRFINPILAVTTADKDLTTILYAGILGLGPDGKLVPDVAESVSISEDGRVYTVVLRKDVTFHDGTPLTTDDIIFTVSRIQDPAIQSPLRASWEGVSTERLSDYEMNFVLPEAYAPFYENLTLGILPEHIWKRATADEFPFSQYNSEPIGAGPYRITNITRNSSGIPRSYVLAPHTDYHDVRPKIGRLVFQFYQSEDALVDAFIRGDIESAGGLSPDAITAIKNAPIAASAYSAPLPRTFAFFFNQNEQLIFRNLAVREALSMVVDRDALIAAALDGHGMPITTPIPPGFGIDADSGATSSNIAAYDAARDRLRRGGWRLNEETGVWESGSDERAVPLAFSIATANAPVFETTANLLKEWWEALGAEVTIRQYEQADLTQTVIRPRQYESLLFGTDVGRELDFFSFWHSSQRNDPGLNVALYANITTDDLLSNARATSSPATRTELYRTFSDELTAEAPAIFLYVPTYTYITAPRVTNVSISGITDGSERLTRINDWYIQTDRVWPFFME